MPARRKRRAHAEAQDANEKRAERRKPKKMKKKEANDAKEKETSRPYRIIRDDILAVVCSCWLLGVHMAGLPLIAMRPC